jgi:hypothetical protein
MEGTWDVGRIRSEIDNFSQNLAEHWFNDPHRQICGLHICTVRQQSPTALHDRIKDSAEWQRELEEKLLPVAKAQGGPPRASNDKQPTDADSPEERRTTAQNQAPHPDSRPPILDRKIELGKWADERLREARNFNRLVHSGEPPQSLREKYPCLFSEVFDKLTVPRRTSFFEDAQRRKLTATDLRDVIADVKGLSGYTLKDYVTRYNRSRKQTSRTK